MFGSNERGTSCGKRPRPCCTWDNEEILVWSCFSSPMCWLNALNIITWKNADGQMEKNAQIQRCSYERLGNAQSWSWLWSCTVASTSVYPCTWFGLLPVFINYRWNPSRRNHRPPHQCDPVRLPYETLPRMSCACKCISLLVRCMNVSGFRIRILPKKPMLLAPWSSSCCQFSNVLLLKTSESLRGTLTFWGLAHSCTLLVIIKASITAPPFTCGAHLTWKTQHDFPSNITLDGEHACARFILTTNNTIRTTTSGARHVWSHCCRFRIQNHMKSSLGINPPLASKSWKHP